MACCWKAISILEKALDAMIAKMCHFYLVASTLQFRSLLIALQKTELYSDCRLQQEMWIRNRFNLWSMRFDTSSADMQMYISGPWLWVPPRPMQPEGHIYWTTLHSLASRQLWCGGCKNRISRCLKSKICTQQSDKQKARQAWVPSLWQQFRRSNSGLDEAEDTKGVR